ncbi:hypothetical protein [Streptomyces asiaticus]|uniref:hypothetical protein n=1 Tax=Streptomyces asiaticus TaxID=114695 RepID=UPI003F67FD63
MTDRERRHSTNYPYIEAQLLGEGDIYAHEEHGERIGPITDYWDTVDGHVSIHVSVTRESGGRQHVIDEHRETISWHAHVYLIHRAPNCRHNRRRERCETCWWQPEA